MSETTAKAKRIRRDPEVTKALILDATERLMLEEGYAAVTTRAVAKLAGLAPGLVHYYYPSTDDVLVAAYRRTTQRNFESLSEVLKSADPLREFWRFQTDALHMALAMEFMALANHRKAIAKEIARSAEQVRAIQVVALERYFREQGIPDQPFQALPLTVMLAAVARLLVMEGGVGMSLGHEETRAAIEALLQTYPGTLAGVVPPEA